MKNIGVNELTEKCKKIRRDLLTLVYNIPMGHLGGELSMVEMAVALYYKYMNWSPEIAADDSRDRFVLSKAHCSETLYTIFQDMGIYDMEYMINHFEKLDDTVFGMHSNRKYVKEIEVSAGSLGHGLPIAVGLALGARYRKADWRTFVLLGDGELDEGTNWEAMMAASHYQLGNLVAIVDRNHLQMTGDTKDVMNSDPLDKKVEAFGWNVIVIDDANDMTKVCEVLDKLPQSTIEKAKPTFIIANTVKGKGVSFMENNVVWHGGGLGKEDYEKAIAELSK